MTKVLRGDQCQCGACGDYFISTDAFDRNLVGRHGGTRRCLDKAGMHKAKMTKDEGFWRFWNPPEKTPTISAE